MQPADSRLRNIAIIVVVVGAAVSAVAFVLLERWLGELSVTASREDVEQLLLLLGATLGVGVLGLSGLGVFCFLLGRQVCREGRFPPQATRVIKDSVVHTGENAVRRGKWAQAFGATLVLFAVALAVVGVKLIVLFSGHAG